MNDPIQVVADALRRPRKEPAAYLEGRTTTLARIAVQALYDAGYRLVRAPDFDRQDNT